MAGLYSPVKSMGKFPIGVSADGLSIWIHNKFNRSAILFLGLQPASEYDWTSMFKVKKKNPLLNNYYKFNNNS